MFAFALVCSYYYIYYKSVVFVRDIVCVKI